MKEDLDYCMSSYLTFRYIAEPSYSWKEEIVPHYPDIDSKNQKLIRNAEEIDIFLRDYIENNYTEDTGILLSGGIDSAIIASYLPSGTKAYTIRFIAKDALDESKMAVKYTDFYNLDHRIIKVYWSDFQKYTPTLMEQKNSPLHPVEVGLYKASLTAHQDGISKLLLGNGADSTFGGLDKLLSKDWNYNDFIERYTFVSPDKVLKNPVSMEHIYKQYKEDNSIDYVSFLKEIHGIGIIQAFDNALSTAGCLSLEPYEQMKLAVPLDLKKIRSGNSKYMLKKIFKKRYPDFVPPNKIAFARPMDQWLNDWLGPKRPEFINYNINKLSGNQKWLVYCLELFLNQIIA